MKPNNTIREIGEALQMAGTIWIIPHELMDGDAFGSAIALCKSLRKENKHGFFWKTKFPIIEFMDKGYCTYDKNCFLDRMSAFIDCGDRTRFKRLTPSKRQNNHCLDHHTASRVFDLNYVDGKAATTGEMFLIYCQK
jgi:phosphoesterase RecJ-like protein